MNLKTRLSFNNHLDEMGANPPVGDLSQVGDIY